MKVEFSLQIFENIQLPKGQSIGTTLESQAETLKAGQTAPKLRELPTNKYCLTPHNNNDLIYTAAKA
jgi:hypothetical protein